MILDSGYPLWNEMRCKGKALYTFNLDSDKKNDDTMTGIDTTRVRPIELILRSDDPNVYASASTMFVMFLSDFIVTFGASDTSTEGSGWFFFLKKKYIYKMCILTGNYILFECHIKYRPYYR